MMEIYGTIQFRLILPHIVNVNEYLSQVLTNI